ncbi:MAG TPA: MarR family winged helix-turn-helix transcriptional regulator [Streptosporangiaceae bacterium]
MQPEFDEQDQRGLQLVHRLRAISVELELSRAAFARAHGLHDTDVRALIHLLDADRAGVPATAGWLGAQLGLTSPSTTALIDRLESAGHVVRARSAADRRKVEIRVSARAVALGWEFFGPLLTGMVRATRSFGAADLDTVDRFLSEVAAAAGPPAGQV